ncbi:hypothetical protein NDU88_001477 [Pleurodeles waltl]|uniref:Uncharacterized protein n=1 Tax=Pleurodeles waltl TaxID=8319 RepID=A0AAV7VZL5_PLEWA|nr:hypothetical protein NDU88_001477 [Pleurodeles waltl]
MLLSRASSAPTTPRAAPGQREQSTREVAAPRPPQAAHERQAIKLVEGGLQVGQRWLYPDLTRGLRQPQKILEAAAWGSTMGRTPASPILMGPQACIACRDRPPVAFPAHLAVV